MILPIRTAVLSFIPIIATTAVTVYSPISEAVTAKLTASRTTCTSPCTVVFSAQETEDPTQANEHEVFKNLGYRFDFNDPYSGIHATTGLPQQFQVGGPMASHTFVCESGVCTYNVRLRAQNQQGTFDDDSMIITVNSPDEAYSYADTICVSETGDFTGDNACPDGALMQATMPEIGQFSGKQVLFRRGEVFDGNLCIDYGEKDVLIGSFGDMEDPQPELTGKIQIGVGGSCGRPFDVNTVRAEQLGDSWTENITVTDLRVPGIIMGMSYANVGLHQLDMNYYSEPKGGFIDMANSTERCVQSSSLDCDAVPYPHGLYMSELEVVGSNEAALAGEGRGVIIAAYNCPMINWLGMIGTTFWNSNSHQFRLEGGQRLSFSHNNMRGHTKGSRDRHTLTLRACGYSDVDIAEQFRHNVRQNQPGAPWTRWAVFADNIHGSPDATNPSFKLQIAPTNGRVAETIVDAIVERSTFITGEDASIDLALNGYYLTARTDNQYTPEMSNCRDTGPGGNPVHGQIDCEAEPIVMDEQSGDCGIGW